MHSSNIVFIGSFDYPFGYAGTKRIQNLIDYIQKHNYTTYVVLTRKLKGKRNGYYKNTKYYTLTPNLPKFLMIILFPFIYFYCFILFHRIKVAENKNILYVYSGINIENIFMIMFAKLIGYRIIVDIVEDFKFSEEKVSLWRRIKMYSNIFFEKTTLGFINGYVVISTYLYDKYKNKVKKILLLPVTANENNFQRSKEKTYVRILYSGTYGRKEGLEYLFKALEKIQEEYEFTEVVLTGKLKKNAQKLLDNFSLKVNAAGYLEEKEYYNTLKDADILVMTRGDSKYANAGFPFKLGEYLATGNAVLATKVSDIESYLVDKYSAILAEAGNSEALYTGIKYLIDNPSKRKEIGLNGKNIWAENFSPERNGRKFIEFVNTL